MDDYIRGGIYRSVYGFLWYYTQDRMWRHVDTGQLYFYSDSELIDHHFPMTYTGINNYGA